MVRLVEVRSDIDGIAWPAIPPVTGAAMLSVLFQVEQTQWWPPERIAEHQRRQLQLLVKHAVAQVPFYRERLKLPAEPAAWDAFWAAIPPLTRQEIQSAGDRLIAERLPEGHGDYREIYTSGSTGRPIRALRTQLWEVLWSAFTVRDHLWHHRDLAGKLATIRESRPGKAAFPAGSRVESWGASGPPVFRTGPMVSLNVTTPIADQVAWLARENPDYLLTHPSIATRLAEHCLAHGISLPRLREVITIAENVRPLVRERCRAAWGVGVADIYSAREVGYIALQCPEREDRYHVQSETVLVEVVDATGHPCPPGETGRVLVTPLHNFAMPLLRYEIGDFVEPGPRCPCGRGLPVIARIAGRRQNMLMLPSGEERWPLLSSTDIAALLSLAPIRQFQFVQRAVEAIELRLAMGRRLDVDEETALTRWIERKFGYPFDVTFSYFDELPRTAAGKFEDFVSEVVR